MGHQPPEEAVSGREKIWYSDKNDNLVVRWVEIWDESPEPSEEPDDLWPEMMLALECLTPKQRFVIECRYGLRGDALEQQEVGNLMGISQQAVQKIEDRSIEKMQRVVRNI